MSRPTLLEARGLCKEFNGFSAVSNVDLAIEEGTVHALIGPNGAGKSTCFNLLTGFLSPTRGDVLLRGRSIRGIRPSEIATFGMVRSFQISAVFSTLTVLENVLVALQRKDGNPTNFFCSRSVLRRHETRADELLHAVDLLSFRSTRAGELSYGRKRALEIATTLALDPEVLLLDEPTAGMTHEDVERMTALIKDVARKRTILMVEHNLFVVSELAQQITVLARGEVLARGTYEQVSRNEEVRRAYLGDADA